MRIGITCYPTYGGSGAVATELGLELARRGHEVHFISYASPFRLRGYAERVTFHEVTQTEYPLFEQSSPYALALAVKQHEVAMRENLDLMHVHYAIPHAATAWLAKQMLKSQRDLKIVTTLHGTDITLVGQDPSYYTLTTFSIEQSDRVTAVSACLRECVASFRRRSCWWETGRSATRRSRSSITSSYDATSASSARWTTSLRSCEAATCSCCRPRPNRSASPRSRRWHAPYRSSRPPWAASPRWWCPVRRDSSRPRGMSRP